MAIKKLKVVASPFLIPEGFSILPTPLLLFQKQSGNLWANSSFESEFGIATEGRFQNKQNIALLRKRPLSLELFSMVGRHDGFILEDRKGEAIPVEIKVSQYGNPEEESYLILIEDVQGKVELENQVISKHMELQTAFQDLKQTQNALIQSAKLASLGEMSSGIAHELNQPLQAILGFSQELEQMETLSETGTEFLHDVVNAAKKMAAIIRSLRSFAREAGDEEVETSIEHAINEASHLMNYSLMQKDIDFECKILSQLPFIKANPIQLEQVFVNFFSNARDAIETAGRARGTISVTVSSKANEINVTIKDNGCGMSEAVQQKIFDPFFTTKEVGKGTGLGMSISYGILKKLQARTTIKSTVGEGTEFTLNFPIIKGDTP